ncbi:2-polyprenyl-6-methoxyphenol hydroxylase-like FAD-dependent oxidoreductase [Afipia massiliensis]|uniref:2-polyprenyl-6-methoxyphenol hydroxylase-like FAD-dependent oxidoreductase n=1 Tax=Afipia massiliensis TaxID=211460 RepID=A0A840N197_9BRAD|nr:FAD-dependent monooxygenase [Afipia massiliensis]MBB5052830.1 2-polyprenyl-6-methoxyphenol hydroxylase-like FAD-dependent oxidoreductase [Afipia massiliensis]
MSIAIIGAGVGGLTAALSLHAAGRDDILLFEAAREIRDVGVGINLPPHAVRELSELGLGDVLEKAGVPTKELAYYDTTGRLIWAEPRGLDAGYKWPQYSIHRGTLQRLLVEAVRERLGPSSIRIAQRVTGVSTADDNKVVIEAIDQTGADRPVSYTADVAICADGIRSPARESLYGSVTPLASNGWVMYRGVTKTAPFLSGRSMVIIGDEAQRIVVYPIADGVLNWLLVRPKDTTRAETELGNWNVPVSTSAIAEFVKDYRFDWLDVHHLVASSSEAYEYPMTDIDPLPRWVFGRCALLGDAAHAMYPFGSNGASQAILDARVLAYELATAATIDDALRGYETQRRPVASEVQLANRRQAGDVMARVSALARSGAHGDAATELQDVERRYKQLAGFDVDALNTRKSWSVLTASR